MNEVECKKALTKKKFYSYDEKEAFVIEYYRKRKRDEMILREKITVKYFKEFFLVMYFVLNILRTSTKYFRSYLFMRRNFLDQLDFQ